jgi:signal transduction histidine kinase
VIKEASYQRGLLTSRVGFLWPLAAAVIIILSICCIYLITSKWVHSAGIDRARTGVVLYGFIAFVPILIVSIFVLPTVLKNDVSSNYAFLAGLFPVAFASYAVIRLRLLDTRIILRKTSVFVIGTLLLSLPIVMLFVLFKVINLSMSAQYAALLLVFMITVFYAPNVWKYIHRLSSRLFFSELYDELELLERVTSRLSSQSDPKTGLICALSKIVRPLGLERIDIMIPPGAVNDDCWNFECRVDADGNMSQQVNDNCHFLHWLNDVDRTVVTEELQRWPRNPDEAKLGMNLAASDLAACVPIMLDKERNGYILIGKKVTRRALSATDIGFLEKSAEHFGLYIDNYALSTKLGFQLEELKKVYGDLHTAYAFKSEIIEVASHEFRTPITVIDGFAKTLMSNWDKFSDEEKVEYMTSITAASKRLMNLTEKFLNISRLEEGDVSFVKVPTKLSKIVQELCANLRQEDLERLVIDGNPELYVVADPRYLEVMLENILENAFQFSPADRPVVLKVWRDSTAHYIQIKDFGKGIPLDQREKIFEPFVRLENLSNHSRGMGLGLHIVRLLSSRLGVEVEIDSGIKDGTTVTLSFAFE